MNFLDVIIILLVLSQAVRWAQIGFFKGFFSLGSVLMGILFGLALAPVVIGITSDVSLKFILALVTITVSAALFGGLGHYIGEKLSRLTKKVRLGPVDAVYGAAFSGAITLCAIWLLLSIFSGTLSQSVNNQIRSSTVMQTLNRTLPPAPTIISRLSSYLNPSVFPRVFVGIEPRPVAPVEPPSSEELRQALAATQGAVLRIESLACGRITTGSGFLVRDNLVVTNAHVIAGSSQPVALNQNGTYRTTPVVFDPDLDIAILLIEPIGESPLQLSDTVHPRGTTGASIGYPGGSALEVTSAAVLRQLSALGHDIYGNNRTVRQVYELQTDVVSGNSGGPVVLPDGTVIGVIFAESQSVRDIGYAITAPSLQSHISEATGRTEAVSTGQCAQ